MGWLEILSIVLGILGLIASILSILFAYITYVTPLKRFKWYLKDPNGWKRISSRVEGQTEYLQYAKHPEFTIVETFDRDWETEEPWIKGIRWPDKKMLQYNVELRVNNQTVRTENFLVLDGWRIYVPIPHIESSDGGIEIDSKEDTRVFYYDEIQILLAGVIGKFHGDKDIKDFSVKQAIKIIQ